MELQTPTFPEALTLPEKALGIVIRDQSTYDEAANFKKDLAAWRKRIVEEFAPMKEAAHRAHKAVTAKEGEYLAPITQAEGLIVIQLRRWADEQERIRQAEQRRLEAEARAAAEADRKRREAEAQAIRVEELRRASEIRAKDEALRLERALEAEKAGGDVEAALAAPILDVPEVLPVEAYMAPEAPIVAAVAAPTYEAVKGLGIPRTWRAEVFSMRLLCAAIGRGEAPFDYVKETPALNSRARADKQLMNIPGVRAVSS
jgi:hypothetical protein